jgi:hypothetical protein
MPDNVKVRLSAAMPEHMRKRMSYRTRMLSSDGDVLLSPSDAAFFRRMGWAEDPAPKAPPQEQAPEPTRAELMALAEERGLELPAGYVRKDTLVELLAVADAEPVEDDGDL